MKVTTPTGFDQPGFYHEIGVRLRFLRTRAEATQQEMADSIGIPRSTYANLERGRTRCTVDVAWRIAVVLGISIAKITPEPASA